MKIQANLSHEHKYKKKILSISKSNLAIYLKIYKSLPNFIYSRIAKVV